MLDDTEATGSECSADGDLTLTYGTTGQEKAGDVDAGDDPEQCRGGEESEESVANLRLDEGACVVIDAS